MRERRSDGRLPAHVVAYLTAALCLFRDAFLAAEIDACRVGETTPSRIVWIPLIRRTATGTADISPSRLGWHPPRPTD